MKRLLRLLGLATMLFGADFARGQAAPSLYTLQNDYPNVFRQAGPHPQPPGPPLPTANQFRSTTPLGGYRTTRLSANGLPVTVSNPAIAGGTSQVEGPTPLLLPRSAALPGAPAVQLASAVIGSPASLDYATIRFGEVIAPPRFTSGGTPLPDNYYLSQPVHDEDPVTHQSLDQFYYSKHADKVFATQSGPITIKWRLASDPDQFDATTYLVSPSPVKPARRIFWTELSFNGPPVVIPPSRVGAVNIVYTANFPATVDLVYNPANPDSPLEESPNPGPTTQPLEHRTLWYDQQSGAIRAYNREGRVFVEYLGNLNSDGSAREHLGFEIVDVVKETRPATLVVDLGETLNPPDGDPALQPHIAAGLTPGENEQPYLYQHYTQGGTRTTLYAIRDTAPASFVNGAFQANGNEVLVYWRETGERGTYWPKYLAAYVQQWPATSGGGSKYSVYVREAAEGDSAKATGVKLSTDTSNTLVHQSDPSRNHARLDNDGTFYTNVSATSPEGFALIRYTNGDGIWFERVWSRLDTSISVPLVDVSVGDRIEPPPSHEPLVGYISVDAADRSKGGDAYDVNAYKNPFAAGFGEAAKGAIIGVNALPGNDTLEVWWFKRSQPAAPSIAGTLWPQHKVTYKLRWPDNAPQIVLASNKGSDDLPGSQAAGSIYYQNDPAKPGYNPNEEHALILSGRAWALRDDLNVPASSRPNVLLSYTDGDGRPAMRVFRVLREDDTHAFEYAATAGTILQAPMPLPLLPSPLDSSGRSFNREVPETVPPDPPYFNGADANARSRYRHYSSFTFEDRKGAHWVYRGPHGIADNQVSPSFRMRYKYVVQEGFAFPGPGSRALPGAVVPYLRPYVNPGDPGQGFVGDPVSGAPLDIVFRPVWPDSAPELRIAETLTLPKVGLPAVRGQASARLLYQQSLARDLKTLKPSARLFDPTRAKIHLLDHNFPSIPSAIKTTTLAGKTYFPALPPHLSERFYFDPSIGPLGALVLTGRFIDSPVGEKYLQLNVLNAKDIDDLKAVGLMSGQWQDAVRELTTTTQRYIKNHALPGAFVFDSGFEHKYSGQELVEIPSATFSDDVADDVPVDSYAVNASGGGTGYVVLLTNNGMNTDIVPAGSPVSMSVFKVAAPLYRGDLKVLTSGNPLDEKVTLQHSGDFAGHPEDYDFEWRYYPGGSEPPPPVYTFTSETTLGNGPWTVIRNPTDEQMRTIRGPVPPTGSNVSTGQNFPEALVVNDGEGPEGQGVLRPHVVLRRTFPFDHSTFPLRLFASLDIGTYDGALVYLNGALVATWKVADHLDSAQLAAVPEGFNPLPLKFEIPSAALRLGAAANANVLTVELYTGASPGTASSLNARLESSLSVDNSSAWLPVSAVPGVDQVNTSDQPPGTIPIKGKMRHVVEGASVFTLSDNYFIVRYRPNNPAHAGYAAQGGWSKWTDPQLAEGWIKRALAGINPFNQRITDLYNNAVDTQVSLVSQSGKPYEGDVALNAENLNDFGLIEIYETILRRGTGLSISGTPPLNNQGANNALLLASGYLSDLYMILGNEAYADAMNPTIAFGADGLYGEITTSLFAFRGQLATVLDEELALLRGRDDFLSPGTRLAPVYNRLFWNYTRGIDAGEAVYAANYNIKDKNADGKIDAADAAVIYPQGHGDAYGHYLTALTGFYGLLHNGHFSWSPRTEDVLVAGVPVRVGYQDERKFAAAAAALGRTASQVVDLTYRKAFTAARTDSWKHLRDGTRNASTGIVRHWGVDEWSARGGQGAFFHWATANSLLPAYDPNPLHQGIQKIDRTTVPELNEIAANAQVIQRSLDNADARLNPLGLSAGALAFDISPTEVDAGRTHYEQIASRATAALQNALGAFDRAAASNLLLRAQADNAGHQAEAIAQQEQAYTNQLIDLYGAPYSDDIGVGKTYLQGYKGPDLFHYAYVDIPEIFHPADPKPEKAYHLYLNPKFKTSFYNTVNPAATGDATVDQAVDFGTTMISYTLNARGDLVKPSTWNGRRSSSGRMQKAFAEVFLAREALRNSLESYDGIRKKMEDKIDQYNSAVTLHGDIRTHKLHINAGNIVAESLGIIGTNSKLYSDLVADVVKLAGDNIKDGMPKEIGMSNDITGPARWVTGATTLGAVATIKGVSAVAQLAANLAKSAAALNAIARNQYIDNLNWNNQQTQLINDLKSTLSTLMSGQQAIDAALRRYNDAQMVVATLVAEGDRIQAERADFRRRAAAVTQGYRTNDYLFRAFRNEALERYRALFDLAAKYTYLAASAYDYETGLLHAEGNSAANAFYRKIVQARSPGVVSNGVPQFGGASTGDPGLAGALAAINADWSVAKTRLGFNNPDRYKTTFSLRSEKYRLLDNPAGNASWRDVLRKAVRADVLDDPDVKRHALQLGGGSGAAEPGLIIEFSTFIQPGRNFFGVPLAGGDHTFSPSSFATKIRASGIAFKGYPGMDSPTTTGGTLGGIGATSPSDPPVSMADPTALSATPYIYLIPAGADIISAPPIGGVSLLRSWSVEDEAIPLPLNIGGTPHASDATFLAADSLSESPLNLRKHQPFRAVPAGAVFPNELGFTNSRLIGRSVWNSRWKLVIPGSTLLANPSRGLDVFIENVEDIKLHLETYSYSGN